MGFLDRKQPLALSGLRTRRDAFEAMLQHLINEKGVEPMDAAKQADDFASIFAKNMGLPEKVEPDRKGMGLWFHYFKQATTLIKENPEAVEIGKPILLGAFTAIAGVFTGAKIAENKEEDTKYESINFDDNGKTMEWQADNNLGGLPDGGASIESSGYIQEAITNITS